MTERFQYTDDQGKNKEAEAYTVSEFTYGKVPNAPVKLGPSGDLHPDLLGDVTVGNLTILRKATIDILRGDLVRASTLNHVTIADSTTTMEDSWVLGVALNDAASGQDVRVLIMGVMTDPLFSIFSPNTPLFLDESGGITDTRPIGPLKKFLCIVGKALGGNDIFVGITNPVAIGA